MNIHYYETERVFKLDTPNTSYLIGIVDEENFVGHIYYGKKLRSHEVTYLMRTEEGAKVPSVNNRDRLSFYDCFPMEYPTQGIGDFRKSCLQVRSNEGHRGVGLHYVEHEIISGKPELDGLPATFGEESDCTTLILTCEDPVLNLSMKLYYTAFHNVDVITRSVQIINSSEVPVYLEKVLSAISKTGYDGVEFAGFYNYSPDQIQEFLKKYNLKIVGIHAGIEELEKDNIWQYVEKLKPETITLAYLPEPLRKDMISLSKRLLKVIEKAQKYKVTVMYHNHAFEFENNQNLLLELLNLTPNLYSELDIFWITVANIDPLTFLKENLHRIKYLHIKELGEEVFGPSPIIGKGRAKCIEVLEFAKQNNIKCVVLESENVGKDYKKYLEECFEVFKKY